MLPPDGLAPRSQALMWLLHIQGWRNTARNWRIKVCEGRKPNDPLMQRIQVQEQNVGKQHYQDSDNHESQCDCLNLSFLWKTSNLSNVYPNLPKVGFAPCLSHPDCATSEASWPVTITVTKDGKYLSWFVCPGTTLSEDTDPSVSVQNKPEGTVYVRWAADIFLLPAHRYIAGFNYTLSSVDHFSVLIEL